MHCRGRGPIPREHDPTTTAWLKYISSIFNLPSAHPPTPKSGRAYSVRYRLRKPRHSSAKGRPARRGSASCGDSARPHSFPAQTPSVASRNLSQQRKPVPPPIHLGITRHHRVHVTPGGHRTPPVPAARGQGGRQGHLTHGEESPQDLAGAWDCRHSSNGHGAQEAAGAQSRPVCPPSPPGCPGFSSAPPKRPPLSPGGSRNLSAAPQGF